MIGVILGQCGAYGFIGVFWAIPPIYLAGSSAAIGMAIINSCNGVGLFVTGFIGGYMKSISTNAALAYWGACYVMAMILLLTTPLKKGEAASQARRGESIC